MIIPLAQMKGLDGLNMDNLGCLCSSGLKLGLLPFKIQFAETDLKNTCNLMTLSLRAHNCTSAHMKGCDTYNTNNFSCFHSNGLKLGLPSAKFLLCSKIIKNLQFYVIKNIIVIILILDHLNEGKISYS